MQVIGHTHTQGQLKKTTIKSMLVVLMFVVGNQAQAAIRDRSGETIHQPRPKSSGISSTTFKDVECSMSDYSCYNMILELGHQEAQAYILAGSDSGINSQTNGGGDRISAVLQQAIQIYRQELGQAGSELSEQDIIYLLAEDPAQVQLQK